MLLIQDELIDKMKRKLAELGATIDEPPPVDEVCFTLLGLTLKKSIRWPKK